MSVPAVLSRAELIAKARQLPPSLLSYFARFPPPALGPRVYSPLTSSTPPSISTTAPSTSTSLQPTTSTSTSLLPPPPSNFRFPSLPTDPFVPWTNPLTNRTRTAFYNRKTQASIASRARLSGVEQLLPDSTVKKTGVREVKRIGTGAKPLLRGINPIVSPVKGHRWERDMAEKVEGKKDAMLGMNKMISEWKQLGYGRGWTKWPRRAGRK